jgi:hypothetical protein
MKKIRQFEELAGADVILIHHLLKNSVAAKEYILMTQAFQELSGGLTERVPEMRSEACEGIGDINVSIYYPVGEEMPLPRRPALVPPRPGTERGALAARWDNYAVGRIHGRTARRTFAHLPDTQLSPLSLWGYFGVGIGGNMVAAIRYWLGAKA